MLDEISFKRGGRLKSVVRTPTRSVSEAAKRLPSGSKSVPERGQEKANTLYTGEDEKKKGGERIKLYIEKNPYRETG